MPAAGFGAWEPGAQVMSSECGGSHASHEDLRHSTGDRWIRLIHGRGSDIPHLEKKKKAFEGIDSSLCGGNCIRRAYKIPKVELAY